MSHSHNTIKAIETEYKGYRFRSRLEARWAVFFDELGLKWEYEPEGFELPSGWYLPDFRVWGPSGHASFYDVKPATWSQEDKRIYELGNVFQQMFDDLRERDAASAGSWGVNDRVTDDMWRSVPVNADALVGDPVDFLLTRPFPRHADASDQRRMILPATVCPRCGEIGMDYPCGVGDFGDARDPDGGRVELISVGCLTCDLRVGASGRWDENDPEPCLPYKSLCVTHKGHVIFDGEDWATHQNNVRSAALAARQARFEHGRKGAH